ncbi:adhesive plaque matrix protein-like [Penaeus monodon]|uniref:adhesive plaque matrix protein-like n=1 Tax=Penaeus monodon TaxID=6687 RepID=UPI0018A7250A|nr:adhesive plaque matrix protein-like [Penaeus monodon]
MVTLNWNRCSKLFKWFINKGSRVTAVNYDIFIVITLITITNDERHQKRQEEARNGYDTHGSYYVLLPDGRVQRVAYTVNGDFGYCHLCTRSQDYISIQCLLKGITSFQSLKHNEGVGSDPREPLFPGGFARRSRSACPALHTAPTPSYCPTPLPLPQPTGPTPLPLPPTYRPYTTAPTPTYRPYTTAPPPTYRPYTTAPPPSYRPYTTAPPPTYLPPTPPKPPTYLPTTTTRTPSYTYGRTTTTKPKYWFEWTVNDHYSGNEYNMKEHRDGEKTEGFYNVLLPDTRVQRVTYTVDGDSGFVAEVTYEGEAKEPTHGHAYLPPTPPPSIYGAPHYSR